MEAGINSTIHRVRLRQHLHGSNSFFFFFPSPEAESYSLAGLVSNKVTRSLVMYLSETTAGWITMKSAKKSPVILYNCGNLLTFHPLEPKGFPIFLTFRLALAVKHMGCTLDVSIVTVSMLASPHQQLVQSTPVPKMVVEPKSCYPCCGGAKQYPLNNFLYHIICFLLSLPPAHVVDSLVCPSLSQPPPVPAQLDQITVTITGEISCSSIS